MVMMSTSSSPLRPPGCLFRYLDGSDKRIGAPTEMAKQFIQTLTDGASWHCSFTSSPLRASRRVKVASWCPMRP